MVDFNLDMLGIAETWLLSDVPDSFISIPNYCIARTDSRGDSRKHGVCIYIKKVINFVSVDVNCNNVCAVHLIDFNLYVIVIYRPPSYSPTENARLVDFMLSFCPGKELLVMGDFNLPALAWDKPELLAMSYPPLQQFFLDCFTSLGLNQWVTSPTFVQSGNILDLILTSEEDRVGDVEVLESFPQCGHCPVILQYFFQTSIEILSPCQVKYSWHRGNYARLNSHLTDIDWEYELLDLSVDEMFTKFKSILLPLIELYVPVASSKLQKNFFTPPNTLKSMRKNAWQSYKRCRSVYGRCSQQALLALEQFKDINFRYRNFYTFSQIDFEKSLTDRIKSSPKCLHHYIRTKKVGAPSVGPLRKDDDSLTANCGEMAEILAAGFSSVYTTHELSAPFPHQQSVAPINDILLTFDDVKNRLSSLDAYSSMGPDGLHPCLIKSCPNLAIPLYMIFQQSLSQSKLPRDWKKSEIIPLFKKGSRHVPLNYRPISLTSVCCKTLEKIIATALYDHFSQHQIFSDEQFGFRQGKTVDDQLLLVYNDVSFWLDSGFAVDVILFDFSKAFDVVCHNTLIDKLKLLGVGHPLLGWISDFLLDRTMRVSVSGAKSSTKSVSSGVPQGSVLGPILFLIYINYLPSLISSKCKLFADDLKIYLRLRRDSDLHLAQDLSFCQRDIDLIFKASESWGLNFNTGKCAVLRFERGTTAWDTVEPLQHYILDNSDLTMTDCQKDLGILVDNSLKFHAHIKSTVNKAAALANNLLRSTKCRSSEFMLAIYKTHIRPLIEFGSTVWHTGYLGDLKLLESVQRRWTREIEGLAELSYSERLKDLNLYSVQGRLLRADLIKCWKIFHGQSSIAPSVLFTLSSVTSTRGHRFKIAKPHVSVECRRRFFSVRCIDVWNSLPDYVVGADSVDIFKRGLHGSLGLALFSYTE